MPIPKKSKRPITCPLCGGELILKIGEQDAAGFYEPEAICQGTSCGVGITLGAFGSGMSKKEIEKRCTDMLTRRPSP